MTERLEEEERIKSDFYSAEQRIKRRNQQYEENQRKLEEMVRQYQNKIEAAQAYSEVSQELKAEDEKFGYDATNF